VPAIVDSHPIELELKAVVPEPAAVVGRLIARGAVPGFSGLMVDRRFDRGGELTARDEVLRVRTFYYPEGRVEAKVSWKGPATVTAHGYKQRPELEYDVRSNDGEPGALFRALGYEEIHRIDRQVRYLTLPGAIVRLEWYPRLDVLLEVEGTPAAIEAAVAATGIPRHHFTAESLADFAARYARLTGRPAILSVQELVGERPSWESGG
jgi:adenylate cyclase class IV